MKSWLYTYWNRGQRGLRIGILLGCALLLLGLPALSAQAGVTPQSDSGGRGGQGTPVLSLTRDLGPEAPVQIPAAVLYEQFDDQSLNLAASQQFEPTFSAYDNQTADDFSVPTGETWVLDQVEVAGSYSTSGHADAVNVFIYANSGSVPGPAVISQTNLIPSIGLDTGSFLIPLASPVTLPTGTYWLSVQTNQRYDPNGQWFWRNRHTGQGFAATWRNPANGFGRCANWNTRSNCGLSGYLDRDQIFRLYGVNNASPTPTATGTPATPTRTRTPLPVPATPTASPVLPPPVITQSAPFTPAPATVDPTPIPSCVAQWRVAASPNGAAGSANIFQSVAAISATDAWAVGSTYTGTTQTLIAHWDGQGWQQVPSPNVGSGGNDLSGVAAVAPNDVWAVGSHYDPVLFETLPLLLHWTGANWNVVPPPTLTGYVQLQAVVALAANDVWAVGGNNGNALTLHWNGTSWVQVPTPVTGSAILNAISAVAPNDIWAVGHVSPNFQSTNLTMHWNGSAWSVVSSPSAGYESFLTGVAAVAANNAWAVGYQYDDNLDRFYHTVILQWNGTTWTNVPSPNPGFQNDVLNAVTALGANDVWAVGYQVGGTSYAGTLTVHWDGSAWTTVPSANGGTGGNYLLGVDGVSATDLWAVGYTYVPATNTLAERYANPCAPPLPTNTPQPTATATATITPTATVTPTATATATANAIASTTSTPTATVCPVQFTDVPNGSTFYTFVRCLACRGIVGGYPCGGPGEPCPGAYFRPNTNVTRGQVSKIVSESAGFQDVIPSTQQTFEDVAPGSTFALWVERLSMRGIIGGYPCGGPFEPCVAPANRPYFRPNNPVTRGQLAKIVSGAAGYTETPAAQTFEDVPPSGTFYLYVERLSTRGIIGGYPCGGPFEPCVAPANRPYFRPNNTATRGQMSKIAANAFFPNCATPARR